MFCFGFVPNGFQKYPGLIFIGSSRSPDKFDGQLAYRGGACAAEMRASPPPAVTRGLSQEVVRGHKVIVMLRITGPSAASFSGGRRCWELETSSSSRVTGPSCHQNCASNLLCLSLCAPLSSACRWPSRPQSRTPRGRRAPGSPWPTQTRALAWLTHPWNQTPRIFPVTPNPRVRWGPPASPRRPRRRLSPSR